MLGKKGLIVSKISDPSKKKRARYKKTYFQTLAELYHQAYLEEKKWHDQTKRYLRRYSLVMLIVGFVLGFVLGAII